MFDRIGRIDDETPFVAEWFAKHGIEVWSTQEGQQCFNSHVDKLMNYLRFWQASGESEKTSIRIKSKMQQMTLEGLYTGGPVRFGYHLTDSGLVNWKGAKIKKYEIDPAESEVLRMIDDMTIHQGCGSYRMADFLNKNGYAPNSGGRLTTMRYRDSYTRADGTEYSVDQIKYSCYHKSRKLCQCDGQTTYQADKVDETVRQVIRKIFGCMDGAPEEEKLQAVFKKQMAGNRAVQKKLDMELTKNREQLTKQ